MSGYIGVQPVPQATMTHETFPATAGQTSFATAGYTPNYLQVFLNGVKLVNGSDFTATNGSDVVLTSGAAEGDTLEVLAYSTFEVNSQNFTGGLAVNNDGATVLTVDRATSDGTLVDFQKDGTSVGSIGTGASELFIGGGDVNLTFNSAGDNIYPSAAGSTSVRDGAVDLGLSFARFKDLYLSGGVYLGGTGAANLLDDYEEGTWTISVTGATTSSTVTYTSRTGTYTRIGNTVVARGNVVINTFSGGSGTILISLPITVSSAADARGSGVVGYAGGISNGSASCLLASPGSSYAALYRGDSNATSHIAVPTADFSGGEILRFTIVYQA